MSGLFFSLCLLGTPPPTSEDWEKADQQGALRIRFMLEGIQDTWELASRKQGEVAQVTLVSCPRVEVNLNVSPLKTTLHFFFPAEQAENGPWVQSELKPLEGMIKQRPLERIKVGVLDLSHLRGNQWYELLLQWDFENSRIQVFLNGTEQGDIFPASKLEWTPELLADAELSLGKELHATDVNVPVKIERLSLLPTLLTPAQAAALASDTAALVGEGRTVFSSKFDLSNYQTELLYEADFNPKTPFVHEHELFDAEKQQRLRQPTAEEWVLEGPGELTLREGALHMSVSTEREAVARRGHLVLWAPCETPDSYLVEYDFKPEDTNRGLHILFWSTHTRDGSSIFSEKQPFREGVFSEYLWKNLHSYHASIFATDDTTPRRVANLRKNRGFTLVACGNDLIGGSDRAGPFKIRLLKDGARMQIEVDGEIVMDYVDDGRANAPAYAGGRLGFRIMAHTGSAELSNFKVYSLQQKETAPQPDESAVERNVLLNFNAYYAESSPKDAIVSPVGVQTRLIKDEALQAIGILTVETEDTSEHFADWIVPIPNSKGGGRYLLTLNTSSPQSKWLILSMLSSNDAVLWNHNEQLSPNLREYRYEFNLAASEEDRRLRLRFRTPGAIELSHLRLESIDVESLLAQSAKRWGDKGPDNLVIQSRFPLGLPTGWSMDREFDDGRDGEVKLDSEQIGISGTPSLKITTHKATSFYSEPFVTALRGKAHVAGFRIKGSGSGYAAIMEDGRPSGKRVEFSLEASNDDWQQIRVPFSPNPLAQVWNLHLNFKGDFWIDALQVHDGETLRDYENTLRPEVALSTGTASRVQLVEDTNTPSTLEWAVSHAPKGSQLRAQVTNIYGETRSLSPVLLEGVTLQTGEVNYAVFPQRPVGVFRIEAWIEDSTGQGVSRVHEAVVHRLRTPHHLTDFAPDSPFGIHTLATSRHLEMSKAVGLNWVRLHDAGGLEWHHLEPRSGEWHFNPARVNRYREGKFEILGLLGTSPLWANAWQHENKSPIHSFWDKWGMPGDIPAFQNYIHQVMEQYKDAIRVYEVWNEPWIPRFFSGERIPQERGEPVYLHSSHPQRDYSAISQAAAQIRNEKHPTVKLIGLNSTGGEGISNRISGAEWTAGVIAEGGVEPVDFVSYHHYTSSHVGYVGDDIELGFNRALGALAQDNKPTWLTEGSNTPGELAGTFYKHLPVEMYGAADTVDFHASGDSLARYVVSALAAGVDKLFLYSMHAHGFLGQRHRFVTLVTSDGYLHPDAAALSNLAWHLEGKQFVERKTVPNTDITLYTFSSGENTVTVVSPGKRTAILLGNYTATDLWGNPLAGGSRYLFFVQGTLPVNAVYD